MPFESPKKVSNYVLSPVACQDLTEIWDYYAMKIGNVDLADRIRNELFQAFDDLVKTPGMGHYRSDLSAEPLRFWRVRDYLVIYRCEKRPLQIVRVLHGKRDVEIILRDTLGNHIVIYPTTLGKAMANINGKELTGAPIYDLKTFVSHVAHFKDRDGIDSLVRKLSYDLEPPQLNGFAFELKVAALLENLKFEPPVGAFTSKLGTVRVKAFQYGFQLVQGLSKGSIDKEDLEFYEKEAESDIDLIVENEAGEVFYLSCKSTSGALNNNHSVLQYFASLHNDGKGVNPESMFIIGPSGVTINDTLKAKLEKVLQIDDADSLLLTTPSGL